MGDWILRGVRGLGQNTYSCLLRRGTTLHLPIYQVRPSGWSVLQSPGGGVHKVSALLRVFCASGVASYVPTAEVLTSGPSSLASWCGRWCQTLQHPAAASTWSAGSARTAG